MTGYDRARKAALIGQPVYADNRESYIDVDPAEKWVWAGFPSTQTCCASGPDNQEVLWPAALFEALGSLAEDLGVPLVYYYCATWGGDVEAEVAWVFERGRERVLFHDKTDGQCVCREGESSQTVQRGVLQEALGALGLDLPTGFFALHQGSFDWSRYWLSAPGW